MPIINPLAPAEFSPTWKGFSGQGAFRYWAQTVLPAVYDDSLSYQELLAKVVQILNVAIEDVANAGDDVTGLRDAYEQLESYVNEYFSEVDVQQEINNKLDTLVENGTLNQQMEPYLSEYAQQVAALTAAVNETRTTLESDYTVTNERISNIIAVNNSTTDNSELRDIRTDWKGVVHSSAGDAVRSQFPITAAQIANETITNEKLTKVGVKSDIDILFNNLTKRSINLAPTNPKAYTNIQDDRPASIDIFDNSTIRITNLANIGFCGVKTTIDTSSINSLYAICSLPNTRTGTARIRICQTDGTLIQTVTRSGVIVDVSNYNSVLLYLYANANSDETESGLFVDYANVMICDGTAAVEYVPYYTFEPVATEFQNYMAEILPSLYLENGRIGTDGKDAEVSNIRVRTIGSPIISEYPVEVTAYNNMRFVVYLFDSNGTYTSDSGWKTNYTIPANTYFRLTFDNRGNELSISDVLENFSVVTNGRLVSQSITLNMVDNKLHDLKTNILYYKDIPSFYQSYIENKISYLIENSSRSAVGDSFCFITDFHEPSNDKDSPSLIKLIANNKLINFVAFGGDSYNSVQSASDAKESIVNFRKLFYGLSVPMFNVIGNHEYNNPGNTEDQQQYELNKYDVYPLMYRGSELYFGDCDILDYYVDNKAQKIRYIFVSCDTHNAIVSSQNIWFVNTLMNTPAGYHIVVFTHQGSRGNGVSPYETQIVNSLAASKSGSTIEIENNTYDFSNHILDPVAIFAGHYHGDYDDELNGIKVITTTTDARSQEKGGLTRTKGDITSQAFDVINIDLTNRIIYMTRIGAGSDRQFNF